MLLQVFGILAVWKALSLGWPKAWRALAKAEVLFSEAGNRSGIQQQQAQLTALQREQATVSSIDSFAQWARLQRQIQKLQNDLTSERGQQAFQALKENWMIWAVQLFVGISLRIWILVNWRSSPEPLLEGKQQMPSEQAKVLRLIVQTLTQRPSAWMLLCDGALWIATR
jgi:hypothetical protein